MSDGTNERMKRTNETRGSAQQQWQGLDNRTMRLCKQCTKFLRGVNNGGRNVSIDETEKVECHRLSYKLSKEETTNFVDPVSFLAFHDGQTLMPCFTFVTKVFPRRQTPRSRKILLYHHNSYSNY